MTLARRAVSILQQRRNEAVLHTGRFYGQYDSHLIANRTRKENLQVQQLQNSAVEIHEVARHIRRLA